jgi:hypothetical protein
MHGKEHIQDETWCWRGLFPFNLVKNEQKYG